MVESFDTLQFDLGVDTNLSDGDSTTIALSSDIDGTQCLPADAERQEATIASITDGGTRNVLLDGVVYPVRYIGIDAPEPDDV